MPAVVALGLCLGKRGVLVFGALAIQSLLVVGVNARIILPRTQHRQAITTAPSNEEPTPISNTVRFPIIRPAIARPTIDPVARITAA